VKIIVCELCKRPFLESKGECPHCPGPYNQDSLIGVGCLILMILPIIGVLLGWIFLFSVLVFQ
jgi:hypothetical protein